MASMLWLLALWMHSVAFATPRECDLSVNELVLTNRVALLVQTAKGELVLGETPYIGGVGHRLLAEQIHKQYGPVKVVFAGEVTIDADRVIHRAINTSGWVHESSPSTVLGGNRSQNLELYLKKNAPHRVGPAGIEALDYSPQMPHLDPRLNSSTTNNFRHDAIDQDITGVLLWAEVLAKLEPAQRTAQKLKEVSAKIRSSEANLRMYLKLVQEEGLPTSEVSQKLNDLMVGNKLSTQDYHAFVAQLRNLIPAYRYQDETARAKAISVYHYPPR